MPGHRVQARSVLRPAGRGWRWIAVRNDGGGTGDHLSALASTCSVYAAVIATLSNSRSAIFLNGAQGTDDTTALTLVSHTDAGSNIANFAGNRTAEMIIWRGAIPDADAKTVCRIEAGFYGLTTSC